MTEDAHLEELLSRWQRSCDEGHETPVEQFCQDHPELLPRLQEHIEALRGLNRLAGAVNRPSREAPTDASGDPVEGPEPLQVPGYEMGLELGRGGMGTVFHVRDLALGRSLALKVLQARHKDNPELARRFLEEAHVMGQLQHPGVPPIHQLGRLGDGRPFFSMKLVQGQTLTDLLRQRRSPADEVPRFLTIFGQICATVAYAHSRGVLHRDLKPSNVMVGAFGEVQVMDWGLAKVLGQASREHSESIVSASAGGIASTIISVRGGLEGTLSKAGVVVGTPAYMAPEQARGATDGLDERVDVFGLGAILCEVLTGQPPYRAGQEDVHWQAAHGQLKDAFARLEESGVEPELVRLAMSCLAADRAERAPNAGAVAAAVSSYEAGVRERLHRAELERAQAEVRVREEQRRRRLGLALAGAVLLLVLTAVVGLGIGLVVVSAEQGRTEEQRLAAETARTLADDNARQADAARRLADTSAAKANTARQQADANARRADAQSQLALEALKSVVFEIQTELENIPAAQAARRRMLEKAIAGLKQVARTVATAGNKDRTLAVAEHDIGDIFYSAGAQGQSDWLRQAQQHYHLGHNMLMALAASNPGNLHIQRDLILSYNKLGDVSLLMGKTRDADESYRKGIVISEQLAATAPGNVLAQRDLAASFERIGHVTVKLGDVRAAQQWHGKALAIRVKLAAAEPDNVQAQRDLSVSFQELGATHVELWELEEAAAVYRKGLAIREKLAAAEPGNVQAQRDLFVAQKTVGDASLLLGNAQEAHIWYRKGLAINEKLARQAPDDPHTRRDLSIGHHKLGDAYLRMGDARAAQESYGEGLAILEKLVAADPANALVQRDLCTSQDRLGKVSLQLGETAKAEQLFRKAQLIRQKLAAADPGSGQAQLDLVFGHFYLAQCHEQQHDLPQAAMACDRALTVLRALYEKGLLKDRPQVAGLRKMIEATLARCRQADQGVGDLDQILKQPLEVRRRLITARFKDLTGRGQHAEAAATADKLLALTPPSAGDTYRAACGYALCASAVALGKASDQLTTAEKADRERYALRAVHVLRQAVTLGYQNLDSIRQNADFDAVRSRADFQALLRDLEAKRSDGN